MKDELVQSQELIFEKLLRNIIFVGHILLRKRMRKLADSLLCTVELLAVDHATLVT